MDGVPKEQRDFEAALRAKVKLRRHPTPPVPGTGSQDRSGNQEHHHNNNKTHDSCEKETKASGVEEPHPSTRVKKDDLGEGGHDGESLFRVFLSRLAREGSSNIILSGALCFSAGTLLGLCLGSRDCESTTHWNPIAAFVAIRGAERNPFLILGAPESVESLRLASGAALTALMGGCGVAWKQNSPAAIRQRPGQKALGEENDGRPLEKSKGGPGMGSERREPIRLSIHRRGRDPETVIYATPQKPRRHQTSPQIFHLDSSPPPLTPPMCVATFPPSRSCYRDDLAPRNGAQGLSILPPTPVARMSPPHHRQELAHLPWGRGAQGFQWATFTPPRSYFHGAPEHLQLMGPPREKPRRDHWGEGCRMRYPQIREFAQ